MQLTGEEMVVELGAGGRVLPVTIRRRGKKLAISFDFHRPLVDEVKCMRGAEWVKDEKVWAVTDCRRNWIQIESMSLDPCAACGGRGCRLCGMSGQVYRVPAEVRRYRRPIPPFRSNRPSRSHQRSMTAHALATRCDEWAAEQGTGKSLSLIDLMEAAARIGFTDWWYVAPLRVLPAFELELQKWRCAVRPRMFNYDILARELEPRFRCVHCGSDQPESRTWKRPKPVRHDAKCEYTLEPGAVCPGCGWADAPAGEPYPICPACGARSLSHEGTWRRLPDRPAPHGVAFDEASYLKNGGAARTEAAQHLADAVREEHDGFVVLMTGTPAPKDPTDWHSQIEIVRPGWLRESSRAHLMRRLAIVEQGERADGGAFPHVVGWKKDEVERLYERLRPLVEVHLAKDCLELPELTKEIIRLAPADDVLRAGRLVAQSSPSAAVALNRLRQLSDGFQYGGVHTCSDCQGGGGILVDTGDEQKFVDCVACEGQGMVESGGAVRAPCPKDDRLRTDLALNEPTGRVVIYAAYHASVDRAVDVCFEEGWDVAALDGRGLRCRVRGVDYLRGQQAVLREMDADTRSDVDRLAFVAHPRSGGFGLNLTAAIENIFYSNDFDAASRWQAEKRSHRMGQKNHVTIKDYVHLPTDEFVIKNLEKKRALQSVTLGEVLACLP